MRKQEFLDKLKASLWAMPEADKQRSADYYGEMIDDRMEDGVSEEEAVAAVGDLDEIVAQILQETPRPPATVEKPKPRQKKDWKIWVIVLLILGAPLWISLSAAGVSVAVAVYISLWSVVISLYAAMAALIAAAVGCILGSFFMIGRVAEQLVAWGAALVCAGLAILLFLLGNLAAKAMIALTKLALRGVRNLFSRKERTA